MTQQRNSALLAFTKHYVKLHGKFAIKEQLVLAKNLVDFRLDNPNCILPYNTTSETPIGSSFIKSFRLLLSGLNSCKDRIKLQQVTTFLFNVIENTCDASICVPHPNKNTGSIKL